MSTTQDYLADLAAKGSAPNTVAAYANDLTQLERFLVHRKRRPEVEWSGVRVTDLAAWFAKLAGTHAAASIARKTVAVRTFLRFAGQDRLAVALPAAQPRRHAPVVLTTDEIERIVASCDPHTPSGLRDAAVLRLAATTGARVSELMGVDLGDVDLATDYVRLGNRDVPFDSPTHDALVAYLNRGRPRLRFRPGQDPRALVLNRRGERLTRQGFWLVLKWRASQAGVAKRIAPHTLRHSFAVRLLADNASTTDVQMLLGHANKASTELYLPLVKEWRRAS